MHFAVLTQYYPPEIGAPQARLSELVTHFVRRGHEVTVLTAKPNYPTGAVFEGYEEIVCEEETAGSRTLRLPIFPSQSAAFVPRLASYFSFVASSALVGAGKLDPPDFLFVESPPLFLGISGIFLAGLKRTRMIFNVSDLWPESAVRLGVVRESSWSYKVAARLEAECYARAWLVTGQSRSILESVSRRFPEMRTYHLSNGCDTTKFGPFRATDDARRFLDPEGGKRVLVYAGLHGIAQGLQQVLDVAARLAHEDRIRFVLIGDGPEKAKLVRDARSRGVSNIRFISPLPASELPAILASADGILVTLKMDLPGAVPSKLYEAMASQKPVVLVASGEAAQIGAEGGCFTVSPGDLAGLEGAVRAVCAADEESLGACRASRRMTERHFDRKRIADQFIELLEAHT